MTILNGSRKHRYGDGGPVKVEKPKMKPHVPPKIKDPIPKSNHKLKRVKKADGGVVAHGTPIGLQKPSTRQRPKVGDKDPSYKPGARRKPSTPSKPAVAKKKKPKYNHRDYRGTAGAIEDAGG
jgi:hypothetical protein